MIGTARRPGHASWLVAGAVALALLAAPRAIAAQERGTVALAELIEGLGTTARVLMIGAHPDDENTQLLTWLARGQHVQAAYLSLTRGDGGQNLLGNELGDALGAIRTEELLAARRIDGSHQYFARGYDFGFSKNAEETLQHWAKDSLLRDVVTVIRAFRPHVIVSVFSGTPRDGHGHHQVAGILAREGYDAAGDTVRFPRAINAANLQPWTPLKFYRGSFTPQVGAGSIRINVGEYNALLGRSYAEIAGESRSQHRSQAFGTLQPRGARFTTVSREASRVPARTPNEQSMFDGIDATWRGLRRPGLAPALDTMLGVLQARVDALRRLDYLRDPSSVIEPLREILALTSGIGHDDPAALPADVQAAFDVAHERATQAVAIAAGIDVEAQVERELIGDADSAKLTVTVYNRGRASVHVTPDFIATCSPPRTVASSARREVNARFDVTRATTLVPDSQVTWQGIICGAGGGAPPARGPWWLASGRQGDMFRAISVLPEDVINRGPTRLVSVSLGGGLPFAIEAPVVYRWGDPLRGDISRPVAFVPTVAVTLDRDVEYAPANAPLDRTVTVTLRSAATRPRDVTVRLDLPRGLTADSLARSTTLPAYGAVRSVEFRIRGRLAPGQYRLAATAESGGERFTTGYTAIEYDHIRPQRLYRDAAVTLKAVDIVVPKTIAVAYIRGVGDNVPPALAALGIPVTSIAPGAIASTDLSKFTTVIVGPRAYESSDELVAANARLLDWVKTGGTMVVQYGQTEMQRPGIMPYPITLSRPADRVTLENSPVTILQPSHTVLTTPNKISAADFGGWQQDRTLYMPRAFDPSYVPLLETHDPGEDPNRGALLIAPYGKGTYVYTTLAFFRQLPVGVPGAARLFINILVAKAANGGAVQ